MATISTTNGAEEYSINPRQADAQPQACGWLSSSLSEGSH